MELLHLFNRKDSSILSKTDLEDMDDTQLQIAVDSELEFLKKKREEVKKRSKYM